MDAMNTIKYISLTLLSLFCLAGYAFAASPLDQERTLEVAFSFTPPADMQSSLTGYKLFKGTTEVCSVNSANVATTDPATSVLSCTFLTEDGTFDFTLAATYSNGSSSPLSPPFAYSVGSTTTDPVETTPPPITESTGSKTISYTWLPTTSTGVAGYRMFMNDKTLCETSTASATTLNCSADLINSPMAFSVASFDASGVESAKSNILNLDPADFPEIFLKKKITFSTNYTEATSSAGGFRAYNNGELLCENVNPTATEITCETMLLAAINNFTVRAVDASGNETLASNTILYTQTSGSSDTDTTTPTDTTLPLAIQLAATPISGEAPLNVAFNASASTGNIVSYAWQFGDGSTGSGALANHAYNIAATYVASLTITDSTGKSEKKTISIDVLPTPIILEPPTAILSSSAAAGNAPLSVMFDASASLPKNNATITAYHWSFGDGAEGSGEKVAHTYSTAGTYYAKVTVTDSQGLTDTVDTPVLVTGVAVENIKPQPYIIATPTTGSCPITVSFDGLGSFDSDGSIASYSWNFGDGVTTTEPQIQHTYTKPASYTVSLQVTDNQGATATATKEVSCSETETATTFGVEVGEVSVGSDWVAIAFDKTFISPVVVAGPPTSSDTEPAVVRIRNITKDGFQMRLQEWDYQDGLHPEELVSYLVMEQGKTTLTDGSKVEAGFFAGTAKATATTFQQSFTTAPVLITTISSNNDTSGVTGRVKNVSTTKFDYTLEEEEAADQQHLTEAVGYIAWQAGKGIESDIIYEAGLTANAVTDSWFTAKMQNKFVDLPYFFATMQTENGGDTAAIRQQKLTTTSVDIKIEEEQSRDSEVAHAKEVVGYLMIGSQKTAGTTVEPVKGKNITFNWEFTADIATITGFRFYMNETLVCETADSSLKQISCNAELPADKADFSMTSINPDGSESLPTQILSVNSTDFPELFGIKSITYNWEYDVEQESTITGFRVYNNGVLACEELNPSSRTVTCKTPLSDSENSFTITAIETTGTESTTSNAIHYKP